MLSVIIAFPKIEDAKVVRNVLIKNDYDVAAICTTGMAVTEVVNRLDKGIIICAYRLSDMSYAEIKYILPPSFKMLLVVAPSRVESGIERDVNYLMTPLNKQRLLSAISDISEAYYREKKVKVDKKELRTNEDKQIILEAKELLMSKNNLTEPEAHRYIQKMSMDSGSSLVETAYKVMTLYG